MQSVGFTQMQSYMHFHILNRNCLLHIQGTFRGQTYFYTYLYVHYPLSIFNVIMFKQGAKNSSTSQVTTPVYTMPAVCRPSESASVEVFQKPEGTFCELKNLSYNLIVLQWPILDPPRLQTGPCLQGSVAWYPPLLRLGRWKEAIGLIAGM